MQNMKSLPQRLFGATVRKSGKNDLPVWAMLFPALLLFVLVSVYPFLWLIRNVLYDYNGFVRYFIGADNFRRLLSDDVYWWSVVHTVEYSAFKLVTIIPLSLVIAVLLNGTVSGKAVFRTVFFVPTVVSAAVASLIFYFIFSPYNGILNGILGALGVTNAKIDWLGNRLLVMPSIIFVAVWGGFGNYMVLFLSGLQGIPQEVYESGTMDGASRFQKFRFITLPMLGPIMKVILMLAITTALKDYESIMVLTGGGPVGRSQVMFLYVYQLMFGNENSTGSVQIGYGSVAGIMSSVFVAAIAILYLRLSRKMDQQ
jgi:raffinose/stachyose/melibiose transport system permease protein